MKQWIVGIIIVGIVGALGFVFIKNQQPKMTSLPDGTTIYDVRTPDEYALNHVTSATLWPLSDLQAGKYPPIAKDAWLAVYCHSGNRAKQAADILKKAGYTKVIDIGGIDDTADYGLAIVR